MSIDDFIYSWVKDLVLLFIIITLVDLVMPKGSMRRYINFVIGLLIIFAVINPFVNLSNLDLQLDREVFRNIDNQSEYNEGIIEGQEALIESLYKDKIVKEVTDFVKDNTEYTISSLDVEIDKTEGNFGAINYLNISIHHEDIEVIENSIEILVKPVVLEYKTKKEEDDEFLHIKELISDRYKIEKDSINISINKLED